MARYPVRQVVRAGPEGLRLRDATDLDHAKRAKAVDFSDGYFDVNQALIANNGSPAIGVTTLAGLKDLKLGAPVGTTSLRGDRAVVQPNVEPRRLRRSRLALKDLKNGQLDGVVVDFPTAFYGYAESSSGSSRRWRRAGAVRSHVREGQLVRRVREPGDRGAAANGTLKR